MHKMLLRSLFLPAFLLTSAAYAQEPAPAPTSPPGQTVLNISATEHSEVQDDQLTASLQIEKQANDPKTLQSQINDLMQQAMTKAKAVSDVQVSTGQYYVYPVDPDTNTVENGKVVKPKGPRLWRGTQGLQLKTMKPDALLPLAGSLQDLGLVMNDLSYALSPQKEEDARDGLMDAALTKLKAKADRAAKILGKGQADLSEVTVDSSSSNPGPIRPMFAMASMRAGAPMAAPSAAPDVTQIDLTVAAKAILKP